MKSVENIADSTLRAGGSPFDVSICILNWNGAKLLAGCLESLRNTCCWESIRCETIVVDNGSTDVSVAMVQSQFPETLLLTNNENRSIATATNQALRRGSGKYFLILNNDVVLLNGSVERMFQFLEQNANVGIVAGRLLNPDGSTQVNYYPGRLPTIGSIAADLLWIARIKRRYSSLSATGWKPDVLCRLEQVPGACMMVRRTLFEKIGLWDSDFTCWYEDVDFCFRCNQAGSEIWYLPDARVIHYGGSTFRELGFSRKTLWRFHGLLRYCAKHFSRPQYILVRLLVLVTLLLRFPVVALLSIWPRTEVRRAWKGTIPAYVKLLAKLAS